MSDVHPLDVEIIARAQNAVLRAYKRLRTWRAVGAHYGVPHNYAWDLALHGVVPSNKVYRFALGLPKKLPSERKARVRRPSWRAGLDKGLERI